jgi:protein TonB
MGTGMNRFVLLSAALHLGVLAALGYGAVRPAQLLSSPLTVTLNEPFTAMTETVRHRTANNITKTIKHTEPAQPSRRTPRQITQNVSSPVVTPASAVSEATAHGSDVAGDPPPPVTIQQSEEPVVNGNTHDNIAAQNTVIPAQQIETTRLASQLEGQLRDALAPYFAYPMMARRNGWQGQVQVGLRVEADGRLSHVRIAHSSGYRLLDSAALATLSRINTVPKATGWLDGRHFDMVLPIDYRLIDGQS